MEAFGLCIHWVRAASYEAVAAGINVVPVLSQTLSSQLALFPAAGAASAFASAASKPDQSTVKPLQQPESTGSELVNNKASNEAAASHTEDAASKSAVPNSGSAAGPARARPVECIQTVPNDRRAGRLGIRPFAS